MSRKPLIINPKCADRLKQFYKDEDISQMELSERILVSQNTLSKIANGKAPMSPAIAQEIRKKFPHINVDWLLGESDFKTIDERIEWNLDFAFSKAKCLDELMKQLAISRWCSLVKSKDESTGESVYAVVEKDMVVAQISFEDYLRTRREIANYAAYLFDNLLARQKRALLKPYPLEEGVDHYGVNP